MFRFFVFESDIWWLFPDLENVPVLPAWTHVGGVVAVALWTW